MHAMNVRVAVLMKLKTFPIQEFNNIFVRGFIHLQTVLCSFSCSFVVSCLIDLLIFFVKVE